MENLNDLLRALVTVIMRYHQLQFPTPTEMSEDRFKQIPTDTLDCSEWINIAPNSTELMAMKPDELRTQLSLLISESTKHNKTRESLLLYLLHAIGLINDTIKILGSDPVGHQENDASTQLFFVELLNNLNNLADNSVAVEYDKQRINLPAFSSRSRMAKSISSFILNPLNITTLTQQDTSLHVKCLFLGQRLLVSSAKQIAAESQLEKVKAMLDIQLEKNSRMQKYLHTLNNYQQNLTEHGFFPTIIDSKTDSNNEPDSVLEYARSFFGV